MGQKDSQATNFFVLVLSTITAAAILANVTILFQLSNRITRLETKLEQMTGKQNLAQNHD